MRITYKILWVEDDNNWYDDTQKLFKETLEEAGFIMDCTRIEGVDSLQCLIEQDGLKKFDLLLVDFKLGEDDTKFGDNVISLIRSANIYTDVIFYSSQLSAVHQKIQENKMEGVYSSGREFIENKFDDIFNKTIKKLHEVNTMRGLLMAETSDLDALMLDIIQTSLDLSTEDDIQNKIIDIVRTSKVNNCKNMTTNFYKKDCHLQKSEFISVNKLIDTPAFTSSYKARVINYIYRNYPNLEQKNFYQNYENDVIKVRNILGHVKEEDGKLVRTTGEEEIFNERRWIKIRKDLIAYRKKLEELKNLVFTNYGQITPSENE